MTNQLPSIALIALLYILNGCSNTSTSTNTAYNVEFSSFFGGQLYLLISKTTTRSTCSILSHHCSSKTLDTGLYQYTIDQDDRGLAAKQVEAGWLKLGTWHKDMYLWMALYKDKLIDLRGENGISLCRVAELAAGRTCQTLPTMPLPEPFRGHTLNTTLGLLFEGGRIHSLDDMTLKSDFNQHASYHAFLNTALKELSDSGNVFIRVVPASQYQLVAYGMNVDPPGKVIAVRFDLRDGKTTLLQLPRVPDDGYIRITHLYAQDDELVARVRFYQFAKHSTQLSMDDVYIYSEKTNQLTPSDKDLITHLEDLAWDSDNRQLYHAKWHYQGNELLITPIQY